MTMNVKDLEYEVDRKGELKMVTKEEHKKIVERDQKEYSDHLKKLGITTDYYFDHNGNFIKVYY
jgi:hypothetical protein